uniref:Uncharacterized protein n=1 Tax=Arundo donax TaxID=35708 RepID=A0A0A9BYS3_ARUDO
MGVQFKGLCAFKCAFSVLPMARCVNNKWGKLPWESFGHELN